MSKTLRFVLLGVVHSVSGPGSGQPLWCVNFADRTSCMFFRLE